MRGFKFTELEEGEKILFGPITFTQTTSFSSTGDAGPGPATQHQVSKTKGSTIGVTDRRVIVEDLESPEKTRITPNEKVQRVFVKRKQQGGRQTITLSKLQTASGVVKLNIQGLPAGAEVKLKETFPNAEIAEDKKCFVATAAYGSNLAPEVATLRRLRDTRLRENRLGHWAIRVYERCSPPLADWLAGRPLARSLVRRLVLTPVVRMAHRQIRS
jgi:hypothetical protein